jgi:hypothetical protein
MNGLSLSKTFYKSYGENLLTSVMSEAAQRAATGLAGEGSECFGFDDTLSEDHDFGPGFIIWLTDEDYQTYGSTLAKAYETNLPETYEGYKVRPPVASGGDLRIGPMPMSAFYRRFTALTRPPQTIAEWRIIPETFLATATNGEVFSDPSGGFTLWRNKLLDFYPEDLRLKKIAARFAKIGQSGQYNYPRNEKRGEKIAALLSLSEFAEAVCSAAHLLQKRYVPYSKWAHRSLLTLNQPGEKLHNLLTILTTAEEKQETIEQISQILKKEAEAQNLTKGKSDFLMDTAKEIQEKIKTPELRQMHIMAE